jgi:hypothetical protein
MGPRAVRHTGCCGLSTDAKDPNTLFPFVTISVGGSEPRPVRSERSKPMEDEGGESGRRNNQLLEHAGLEERLRAGTFRPDESVAKLPTHPTRLAVVNIDVRAG